jgi:PAS domain S-box-containing protein
MAIEPISHTKAALKTSSKNDYPAKSITETIINGFFTVDRNWIVKYWNKAAEKLLGVSAKDIVGKNLWKKFAGAIPINFYEVYHKAFLQDNPVHFEEYWGEMGTWSDVITYHCGDTVSISFKSSNQSGNLEFPGNLQKQLEHINELYRFVTEVTNDCLWEWNLQNKEIFWIDGGHNRVFGYQVKNALIPQSFWESCLHPDDKVRLLAGLHKIITTGSECIWEDEYRFKKSDGSYANVHDRGHIIYNKNKRAVRMIGATRDMTARKLIEIQLQESERKLAQERLNRQKEVINAVRSAHETERMSIGKELHDNINQILGATLQYIDLAKTDEASRDMLLEKSSGYISTVIEEIRKISKTLICPSKVMDLVESIKNLLDDLKVIHSIKIEFHAEGITEEYLDEKIQLNIFRIVQEQLNNVLKHAKATRATINLTGHANEIILLISDNGEGFDTFKERKGVGLISITNRAELYNGKVMIVSKPGKGVQLKVVLPYPKLLLESHIDL